MKKLIIAFCVLGSMLVSACVGAPELSPEQVAVSEMIAAQAGGELTSLKFTRFEKIDSTTYAKEISNRVKTFELKFRQDSLKNQEYKQKGMLTNARVKNEAMERDRLHLSQMEQIRQNLSSRLDDIIYYDYIFSAAAKLDGSSLIVNDYYACITPDGKVLSMVQDKKNLHKGTGKAIPGYAEIFSSEEE